MPLHISVLVRVSCIPNVFVVDDEERCAHDIHAAPSHGTEHVHLEVSDSCFVFMTRPKLPLCNSCDREWDFTLIS